MNKPIQQNYCYCGEELTSRHQCELCGIMIGPRHLEKVPAIYYGKTYCSYCFTMKTRTALPSFHIVLGDHVPTGKSGPILFSPGSS